MRGIEDEKDIPLDCLPDGREGREIKSEVHPVAQRFAAFDHHDILESRLLESRHSPRFWTRRHQG